ncbi:protein turtle homolog A-like [Glandiceps talaboti]
MNVMYQSIPRCFCQQMEYFWVVLCIVVLVVNTEVTEHHVRSGENVILHCDVNRHGNDVPYVIQWEKQGIGVPIYLKFGNYPAHIDPQFEGRLSLVNEASLMIYNIQTEDEGQYECKVMFLNGEHNQLRNGTLVHLIVSGPPTFLEASPSRVTFQPGHDMVLVCKASGNPPPTVTWTKDGEGIESGPRTQIDSSSLTLFRIGSSDSGAYVCMAQSTEGESMRTIRVVVQGPPHFVVRPQNATVRENGQAIFECEADGSPSSITYRWYKDSDELERFPNLKNRVEVLLQGTIMVHSVRPEDEGLYTCRPDNGVGNPPPGSAFLAVLYTAYVKTMPLNTYIPNGLMGIIPCTINSNPPLLNVIWIKDGTVVDTTDVRYDIRYNGDLLIKEVDITDQGQYTCTPYNELGTRGESLPTNVLVKDPPIFSMRPCSIYQREEGHKVTFHCEAEGNPRPTIQWRRGDGTVPKDRTFIKDGSLTISYLQKDDHGMYECLATNAVATIITATQLIIEGTTPHAPTNVTVLTGIYAALVSWLPAYNGGLPQHYIIWYKEIDDDVPDNWQKIQISDERATSIILYNLQPSTSYEISVLSMNSRGESLFSEVVFAITKDPGQYVPIPTDQSGVLPRRLVHDSSGSRPSPPRYLRVNETDTGILISWTSPLNTSGPITRYIIEYQKVDEAWMILEDNIPVAQHSYLALMLEPDTHYAFRVFALTKTAFSQPSSVVLAYTGDLPMYYTTEDIATPIMAAVVGALCFLILISLLSGLAYYRIRKLQKAKKRVTFADMNRQSTQTLHAANSANSAPKRPALPKLKPILTPFFKSLKDRYLSRKQKRRLKKKKIKGTSIQHKKNKGVTVNESIFGDKWFPRRYKIPADRVEVNYSGPISRINRTADGKFVLKNFNNYRGAISVSRPDLLPNYHDDISGMFGASSETSTTYTNDENCSTSTTDSQVGATALPKIIQQAPKPVYNKERVYTSSPAAEHDGKPLVMEDVSSVHETPNELSVAELDVSGWERWTKKEIYDIMRQMQAEGNYECEYCDDGNYESYETLDKTDNDNNGDENNKTRTLPYPYLTTPSVSIQQSCAQSAAQLDRPTTADAINRPSTSAREVLSRRPSQRIPVYSPNQLSEVSTASTLCDVSSLHSSQQTVSVDVHRSDREDLDWIGAGDYVRIRSPTHKEGSNINVPSRRKEDTPVAPIKPMRSNVTCNSDNLHSSNTIQTPHQPTDKEFRLTDLPDGSISIDHSSQTGECSPPSRASITSTTSSGRGSKSTTLSRSSRSGSFRQQDCTSPSFSSGFGSRTTSHSTMLSHQHSEIDQTSLDSPFSGNNSPFSLHQKDNSIDENYEFDSEPLQSELLEALKNLSMKTSTSKKTTPSRQIGNRKKGVIHSRTNYVIPKVKTFPQYEDTAARCAKLKEEFLEYRRKVEAESQNSTLTNEHELNYETTTVV